MRDKKEIQRAHDLWASIILGEMPIPMSEDSRKCVQAGLAALCWVLQHPCSDEFAVNEKRFREWAAKHGYVEDRVI